MEILCKLKGVYACHQHSTHRTATTQQCTADYPPGVPLTLVAFFCSQRLLVRSSRSGRSKGESLLSIGQSPAAAANDRASSRQFSRALIPRPTALRARTRTHTLLERGDTNYPLIAFLIQATPLASLMMKMQCLVCTSVKCARALNNMCRLHYADCNSFQGTE